MNLKSNEVQRFYSDITIGKREIGRITFELFADKTPKAAENFGSFASVISANDTLEKNCFPVDRNILFCRPENI